MSLQTLLGRSALADYYDYDTFEVFVRRGQLLNQVQLDLLDAHDLATTEASLHGLSLAALEGPRWVGWGIYKNATARATLREGNGILRINGQLRGPYFKEASPKSRKFLSNLLNNLEVKQWLGQLDVLIQVHGSSPAAKRQINAVAHAVANGLANLDREVGRRLVQAGYGGVRVDASHRFKD
jgi:ribosomal protein S9